MISVRQMRRGCRWISDAGEASRELGCLLCTRNCDSWAERVFTSDTRGFSPLSEKTPENWRTSQICRILGLMSDVLILCLCERFAPPEQSSVLCSAYLAILLKCSCYDTHRVYAKNINRAEIADTAVVFLLLLFRCCLLFYCCFVLLLRCFLMLFLLLLLGW